MTNFGKPFLTAQWRYLAMVNYEIDPAILAPYLPRGTELDSFNGKTLVSMVGFLFLNTRVMKVAVPFHENFEEVNLRFYVRRRAADGWRRGVVFIKEIVPRLAIALTARWIYNENYVAVPMGHVFRRAPNDATQIESAKYYWSFAGRGHFIEVATRGAAADFVPGSEEEFIAEHYWGYAKQRNGCTVEYRVDHPPWRIWQTTRAKFECDIEAVYGGPFVESLSRGPASAFLAGGSAITVYRGVKL